MARTNRSGRWDWVDVVSEVQLNRIVFSRVGLIGDANVLKEFTV